MNNTNSLKLCSILCPRLCSSACVLLVTSSDGALQHFSPPVEQEVPPLNPAPLYTERLQMQPQNSHSSESSKAESLFGRSNKSCQSINPPTSCLLATSDSSAISFILITLTIKGSGACIIHDTAALMSEIKCNKLEITSLRHCDSIKILGNIGPCIIEGPARQDSCQACQACCNYWIWPVTHTQINPVKITGYIDFFSFFLLFLFASACECVRLCRCRRACACRRLHFLHTWSMSTWVCVCNACCWAYIWTQMRCWRPSSSGSWGHIWSL